MSWKMFVQIVLLIVIAAIVLTATKYSARCMYGPKHKPGSGYSSQK